MLSACGERFGVERETALRVSGAFGGGMARMGETCGAVTGAMMVIGLRFAMTRVGAVEEKQRTHATVQEFVRRFKERNGSIVCRELIGCDLITSEGVARAGETEVIREKCPAFVKDAVEIVQTLT